MKAPSQDFTVLSRGLFLFSGAFAFTGRCGAFRGLGVRLPSCDAKGVLQLAYGGERGFLFVLRPFSFAECTEMISKDQQSVNLTARVFVRPCRPCCIAATFASYHGNGVNGLCVPDRFKYLCRICAIRFWACNRPLLFQLVGIN